MRLGYTLCVPCINCCGGASTRPMCSHELKCVQMIKERDSVQENRIQIEQNNESNDCAEFENGTENAHTERRKISGLFEFTSKVPRLGFFLQGIRRGNIEFDKVYTRELRRRKRVGYEIRLQRFSIALPKL